MINKLRSLYQKTPVFIRLPVIRTVITFNKLRNHAIRLFRHKESGVYKSDLIFAYNKQRQFGFQQKLCYAPFSSMFFSIFGKAAPCYATYDRIHAQFPGQTIKEIWQGEEFKKIREQVKKNDLSDICNFCHIPFITRNFGSMLTSKYDNYHFYGKKYPSIMEFELSNSCNLQCIMCNGFLSSSIRSQRERLPVLEMKYDNHFVDQLEEFIPHLKVAEFTGGDPLLIDIYYKIWDRINSINPYCNLLITTNANTMNEKFTEVLSKNKRISFNVSIESLNKEVYESIRIGANFERTMENISIFHEYCRRNKTTINFLVCPLRQNWKEFPGITEYCNSKGICVYFHRVLKPLAHTLWNLPSDELMEIHSYLKKFDFPAHDMNQKINRNNYLNLVSQIYTWYLQSIVREKRQTN